MKSLGYDISKWSGIVDFDKSSAAGVTFAFIRCGSIDSISGVPYTDWRLERNAAIAPRHFPIGFYWYARPQFDYKLQVQYFVDHFKEYEWALPPVLDLETDGGLSKLKVSDFAVDFLEELKKEIGVAPLFYSSPNFIKTKMSFNVVMEQYPLWIAHWGTQNPIIPEPWTEAHYHQFSADGNGRGHEFGCESADVDLDWRLVDNGPPPPPSDLEARVSALEDWASSFRG